MGASSETALTGQFGAITVADENVARTTKWSIKSKLAHTSEWGDSDSQGHTNRAPGRHDRTNSIAGKYDTDVEQYNVFDAGDIVSEKLYPSLNNPDQEDLFWYFPRALCSDFSMDVDMDSEEVIGWTSEFGEDGPSFRPGESPAEGAESGAGQVANIETPLNNVA